MLRIAVPNKGMLSEPAWNMLAEAGYRLRTNPRQLVVQDPDNGIELFYLRPLDIAVYVGRGAIDVGITGQDLLKNSGTAALEHMPLGFGASTFRFAAPNESPITTLEDVQGKRVATTFDKLVHDYLVEHGIQAETIHLDGAVESSVQLGVADLIADVVSTLHDKQWNAVRVMVPKAKVNQLMDDLYEVGARGIIVTALQASRM